jgi:hypothetical protein
MSARRAVSLWVPITESFIHTMRLLVAASSDRRYGCQLAAIRVFGKAFASSLDDACVVNCDDEANFGSL